MSKSWHLVNYLKTSGPLNQTALWSHFKPTKLFRSRTNMKDVLNNLRKIDRLNAVGVNYTHSGIKDHLYMVTSLRSNFLPQDVTLAALQKRQEYGVAQKAFFKEIENAEKTLMSQYHATHPQLKANYENTMRQKARSRKGLLNFRKKIVKDAAVLAVQKKAEREKMLEDTKKELVIGPQGSIKVKDQKNTQARKIAMEVRRVAGERKTIALMHAQMIEKGQRKAAPRLKLAEDRVKAGPLGTPERDAFEEQYAKKIAKRGKELKKWRDRRSKRRAAIKVVIEEKPSAQATQDQVVQKALQAGTGASPPSQFREEAAKKLKAQRESEANAVKTDDPKKETAPKIATNRFGKPLNAGQLRNQTIQKRQVKMLEEKLNEKKQPQTKSRKVKASQQKGGEDKKEGERRPKEVTKDQQTEEGTQRKGGEPREGEKRSMEGRRDQRKGEETNKVQEEQTAQKQVDK